MTYDHINNGQHLAGPFDISSPYIRKLTRCGTPEVLLVGGIIDLGDLGKIVPRVYAVLADGEKYGEPVVEAEQVYVPGVSKSAEDIKAETYVYQITPRQCRLWLAQAGLLTAIEQAIAGMGAAAGIEWEYALEIKRDHPLVLGMQAALGKTDDEMHQMFWQASQL